MPAVPLQAWLVLAALLFAIGLYTTIARRNAIGVVMGIEIMFAAVNINFLAFWRYKWVTDIEAPVFITIIILVAACEAAVALAIVLSVFRRFRTIDVESVKTMEG
jgi:NADH-quinone oxidoreductase subunit K